MSKSSNKPDISVADSYKKIVDRWEKLSAEAKLPSARSAITSLESQVEKLPAEVVDVRKRGYAFAKTLENDAKKLRSRWNLEERAAKKVIHDADPNLKKLVRDAERQLGVSEKRRDLHDDVDRKLDLLEDEIEDVEKRVDESLRDVRVEVNEIQHKLREATKLLDALNGDIGGITDIAHWFLNITTGVDHDLGKLGITNNHLHIIIEFMFC